MNATIAAQSSIFAHRHFLKAVLMLDAASCFVMGSGLLLAASPLAVLTDLPAVLLALAGASLLPTALFMAVTALRAPLWRPGVWVIVWGNIAWVAASIYVLTTVTANAMGISFIATQALAVAVLAALEWIGLLRRP